jgi:hypothetical protein
MYINNKLEEGIWKYNMQNDNWVLILPYECTFEG